MNIVDCEQGSPEWHAARCGSLGASSIAEVTARTKTGWSSMRANAMARLIAERLTNTTTEGYVNEAMRHGTEQEPIARSIYETVRGASVQLVGLVLHPVIPRTHASPDGLVGDDGLVEIKCPNTATHIDTLLGAEIDGKYVKQMQWQMACTGRAWCDFVSFDPRMPEEMQLHVARIHRDDDVIKDLEKQVAEFLCEVEAKVLALQDRYLKQAAE